MVKSNAHFHRQPTLQLCTGVPRMRRFSASFSPLSGPSSPKLTPRVNQLRREESVDLLGREAAHERELNSAMVMSQSWEDLTLVADKVIFTIIVIFYFKHKFIFILVICYNNYVVSNRKF